MIWADRVAKELKGKIQHVDDMKTPSGFIHTGSLRGPILHDVIYRVLKQQDDKTVFTYIFNDFDPIDGLSEDLTKDFTKYLGYPLRLAPSPDGKARSFADFFAADFKKVLRDLGCEATYLSSWDMYHEGKFNEVIRMALDHAEKIQDIYQKISGSKKRAIGWYPFQVICPKCSKIGTTKVMGWDKEKVKFICEPDLVKWAKGCGNTGTISPFDGNGKLPWKVDWPAHWKVLGITFEGAGKDHASKGGSYDIAFTLCEEVFQYPKPYHFPYEHFLLGGRKMSSSKGVGLRANDLTSILPPELGRFLMVRTVPNRALEFDPIGNTIPDLFDEFDRCAKAYWQKTDPDLARIFELSMVNNWYQDKVNLPRFSTIIQQLKHTRNPEQIEEKFNQNLSLTEKEILKQRIKYAQIWLAKFTPQENKFSVNNITLTQQQKDYLKELIKFIKTETDSESLQSEIFKLAKSLKLPLKEAFGAIYISLTGKNFGPKAGELLLSLGKEFIIKRFSEVSK